MDNGKLKMENFKAARLLARILLQCARFGAVGETVTTAGAFAFDDFVHVVNVLHLGMHGAFGADFAAQAAGDTESFNDTDFHQDSTLSKISPGPSFSKRGQESLSDKPPFAKGGTRGIFFGNR